MEVAVLIVSFGMLVVSGVAATVAVVQARQAAHSERAAGKARDEAQKLTETATTAFVRQAEAQERANSLKEKEMTPPAWATRYVSGDLYQAVNTSGRTIHVLSYDVQPDGTEKLVRLGGNPDGIYLYGDAVDYMVSRRMGPNARKLILNWHFDNEPAETLNQFIITL